IRDLEVQSTQQKKMLLRREEEIRALKKLVKPMSDRTAGRLASIRRRPQGNTPQKARNKWSSFEKKFNKLVVQRISFDLEEKCVHLSPFWNRFETFIFSITGNWNDTCTIGRRVSI